MLQLDKILHFIVSFFLIIILNLFIGLFWGIIFTSIIGLLKEVYDHYHGRFFSWGDLLANFIGIIVAIILIK